MTDARDPDMAAAELALGVLDGDERASALRRVLAEPGFAAEVERWRDDFAALFAQVPAVEPAPSLFDRIERSLDGRSALASVAERRGWLWPSIAGAASLAAAASIALLVTQPEPAPRIVTTPPTQMLAGVIAPTETGAPVSAVYDPGTGTLLIGGARFTGADRSAQLWVIGGDGVPYPLGLLQGDGTTRVAIAPDARRRLAANATLAISDEPIGGSPTGQPTGPIVAKGTLSQT